RFSPCRLQVRYNQCTLNIKVFYRLEALVIEDRAHDDIAFIRAAIEQGRNYATGRSPDLVVWGIALAIGYLGAYGFVRGWSGIKPGWPWWTACIALPWLYSLRRPLRRLVGDEPAQPRPIVVGLRMMWLGWGVPLTTLCL